MLKEIEELNLENDALNERLQRQKEDAMARVTALETEVRSRQQTEVKEQRGLGDQNELLQQRNQALISEVSQLL